MRSFSPYDNIFTSSVCCYGEVGIIPWLVTVVSVELLSALYQTAKGQRADEYETPA